MKDEKLRRPEGDIPLDATRLLAEFHMVRDLREANGGRGGDRGTLSFFIFVSSFRLMPRLVCFLSSSFHACANPHFADLLLMKIHPIVAFMVLCSALIHRVLVPISARLTLDA